MEYSWKCCETTTMFGYSLQHGVIFVGTISTLISIITLAHAVATVAGSSPGDKGFNGQPMMAFDMIFGLYSLSVSLYQILISMLLYWQAARTSGDIFICTLWHVSHLSILTLYCLFITAKTALYYKDEEYIKAAVTAGLGLLYKAVFLYFSIVVNSFSHSLDEDIYY